MTHNQYFSGEADINHLIQRGAWYSSGTGFIVKGMLLGDLRITVVNSYQLEEVVAARVVIKYHTACSTKNSKVRDIIDDGVAFPTQDALNTKSHTLVVHMKT